MHACLVRVLHELALLEFSLPPSLSRARHQAVVWIDGLVLTFCQLRFIGGSSPLILPLLGQTLLLSPLCGKRLCQ